MGTRCGDLDPAIVTYLMQRLSLSLEETTSLLNKESGLKGLCGDNDLRLILKRANKGDQEAKLALEIFSYRIKKYIGAFAAVLGRLDAVVFTGGIGEHVPYIRSLVLDDLENLFGIVIDADKNNSSEEVISQPQSRVKLLIIKTDEELQIALETSEFLQTP